MDRYTLFLSDFSASARQVLVGAVATSQRFTIVGSGAGESGYATLCKHQPDVVICDVTQATEEGLALIRRIQADYPDTATILLNAARDFETAHEAIALGVTAYWVAPLRMAEAKQHLARLQVTLDERRQMHRQLTALKRDYDAVLPLRQGAFLTSLIEGHANPQTLDDHLTSLELSLSGPAFACLAVHTSHTQLPRHSSFTQLTDLVRTSASEYFAERWSALPFPYQNETVVLINLPRVCLEEALIEGCDQFVANMQRLYGAVVTIGVGEVVESLAQIPQAYASAQAALSYRSVSGDVATIQYTEIAPKTRTQCEPVDSASLWRLLKLVHHSSLPTISVAVDQYLDELERAAKSVPEHTVAVADMLGSLYRFAASNHLECAAFEGDLKELYRTVVDFAPTSLRLWLLDVCQQFNAQLQTAEEPASDLVSHAQAYVHEHYGDEDLSLSKICQELDVSNAYFSSLFKKKTGTSFIAYLTDYRMDQAARLLLETREKSHVIGELVGFGDANYFSTVFKRHFGESPVYYRQARQTSGQEATQSRKNGSDKNR